MPKRDRQMLYEAIVDYGIAGIMPELSANTEIAFSFVKASLDNDSDHYREVCRKRAEMGRKGGAPVGNTNAQKKERETALQPVATPSKPKKTKEEIKAETEKRRKAFYDSLIPYVQIYGKEMVRAFYNYWSELNKSCTKMRWEQETTWEVERRLATWENKDAKYNRNNGTGRTNNSTAEERANDASSIVANLIATNEHIGE